jgi:hypothetical protein
MLTAVGFPFLGVCRLVCKCALERWLMVVHNRSPSLLAFLGWSVSVSRKASLMLSAIIPVLKVYYGTIVSRCLNVTTEDTC